MIEIDGSYGEGGGAILRQALGMAAYARKAIRVYNIRAGREKPGLAAQHLRAVEAAGAVCGARVRGAKLGSSEVLFEPNQMQSGAFQFDVGTAGSATLILQTVLLPCLSMPGEYQFEITGGTDVPWSPPADYLKNVTLPVLAKLGDGKVAVVRRGYYPKGGGRLLARLEGGSRRGFSLVLRDPGDVRGIKGVSHATEQLRERKVAERQATAANHVLMRLGYEVSISVQYSDASNLGSGITLWTESDNGPSVAGSALGVREKAAEEVGREAARELLDEVNAGATVDRYLADQLIPFIAVSGGSLQTSEITAHTRSCMHVAEQVLGARFLVDETTVTARK